MTFRTKDAARKLLVKCGVPSGLAAIGLHVFSKRDEQRLAPPPEHVPHGEYQLIPPSFVDRRAGGSTNRPDDFPIGGILDGNDILMRLHQACVRRMKSTLYRAQQASSALYMST